MLNTKIFIIICLFVTAFVRSQELLLKTCSRDNVLNCPANSLCTQISQDDKEALKCLCLENYQLNPAYIFQENLNGTDLINIDYCLPSNWTASIQQENKLLVYIRSPARKEHLAYGILMVLLAAALATAVLYGLKVLRPLKRTKLVYQKLLYQRRNITPLQEMDELELNRRYEMQTL